MKNALRETKNYLAAVLGLLNKNFPADITWYKSRRNAEESINHAFYSVQRMIEEPDKQQALPDVCFSMVGALIRINREITSVALLIEKSKSLSGIESITEYLAEANGIFYELSRGLEPEDKVSMINIDFSRIKSKLNSPELELSDESRLIKGELEKIIFELEALTQLEDKL